MGPVSATTAIDAPRERVYALLVDLAFRPAFTDHFIDEFRLERRQREREAAADATQRPWAVELAHLLAGAVKLSLHAPISPACQQP